MPGAPEVDFDLTFTLRWGEGKVHYAIEGCHDPWPMHEAYLNGRAMFTHTDNGNILSLFEYCGQSVNESGDIQ